MPVPHGAGFSLLNFTLPHGGVNHVVLVKGHGALHGRERVPVRIHSRRSKRVVDEGTWKPVKIEIDAADAPVRGVQIASDSWRLSHSSCGVPAVGGLRPGLFVPRTQKVKGTFKSSVRAVVSGGAPDGVMPKMTSRFPRVT